MSTTADARTHPLWKKAHPGRDHILEGDRCILFQCGVRVMEDPPAEMPTSFSMASAARHTGQMVPMRFSGPITSPKKPTRAQNAPPPDDHAWREP